MVGFLSKLTGGGDNKKNEIEENFNSNIDYSMEDIMDSAQKFILDIDAYEDEDNLYIRAFIPSIDPKELNIDISRDTITISGERFDSSQKKDDEFFQQELSWGKFTKKIVLPKEIDIESTKASTNLGTLTIKLPKIDKNKSIKVNIN